MYTRVLTVNQGLAQDFAYLDPTPQVNNRAAPYGALKEMVLWVDE